MYDNVRVSELSIIINFIFTNLFLFTNKIGGGGGGWPHEICPWDPRKCINTDDMYVFLYMAYKMDRNSNK